MNFFSGSGSRKFLSFRLGNEMSGQPIQGKSEDMEIDQQSVEQIPEPEVSELPVDKTSIVELLSSTATESCEAYFTQQGQIPFCHGNYYYKPQWFNPWHRQSERKWPSCNYSWTQWVSPRESCFRWRSQSRLSGQAWFSNWTYWGHWSNSG